VLILDFSLPKDDRIHLDLYDASGRWVTHREPATLLAGEGVEVRWSLGDLAPGVYFLRVVADSGFKTARRIVALD
jgi:hypothetical protein